ncbi:MAG: YwiC-like family protein [Terracidiphilus sp.]
MSRPSSTTEASAKTIYLPREHGATAMVITPIVCAAILARSWRSAELATLAAAFASLAAKDPLVVLMRQRFVWKQAHAETPIAARWFAGWTLVLAASGLVLLRAWPLASIFAMGAGVVVFSLMAIWVNIKNRQRSTLFQIASAAALTSSSLATCLSAVGAIRPWCWWLWALLAMQATAGILVVHARLDARIALRGKAPVSVQFRRTALIAVAVLAGGAAAMLVLRRWWLALALALAAAGYAYDLRRQKNAAELQRPLISVGRQALTLATVYALLLVAGLW